MIVTIAAIAAGVALLGAAAKFAPRLWGQRPAPATIVLPEPAPVIIKPATVPTDSLPFKVVRVHGDHSEILYPTAVHIGAGLHQSGAYARVIFENAKLGPQRGRILFVHNGKVRDSHG